jgi:hypothetical protein
MNLGYLAYYKPGAGLTMLRENILGEEKFDAAFREYIKRWAFKHPTPDDFFRTMENVAGEELNWFWRGWFMNKWKIDQGVKSVKYVDGNFAKGSLIKLENIGQLPMPVDLEVKYKDGTSQNIKLPVEIWKRNTEWTFEAPTTKEIVSVKLDPKGTLPDADLSNNTVKMGDAATAEKVNLQEFTGVFSSPKIPGLKFTLKVENGKLMAQATGQQFFPLDYEGDGKFSFAMAGIEMQFSKDRKSFDITQGGQSINFIKE